MEKQNVLEFARKNWNPIMRKLREERGRRISEGNWGCFNLPISALPGRVAPLSFLNSRGCRHAWAGGCTMCDYTCRPQKPEDWELMQAAKEMCDHIESVQCDQGKYILFNVNGIGSFFDTSEVPADVRRYILSRIAAAVPRYEIVEMATESRLEFITDANMSELRQILGSTVKVEMGFGIESMNPLVREGCINKHLPADWREKCELMHCYDVKVCAHLQLGAPLLTEAETLEDVYQSAVELQDSGLADALIVMSMNLKKGTLVGQLYEEGLYQLPSPWSVVALMRRLGAERCRDIHFFGFVTDDPTIKVSQFCSGCEATLRRKILRFSCAPSEHAEILALADSLNCECKFDWVQRMTQKHPKSLEVRIVETIERLATQYKVKI
ncbi:MAG: hypothetical protein UT32_C0017G0017 [Parcubacteria group bacterium GW2011_GWC2_39_14]|nr:MAG: hypothetical protein UT32_C0017G0017 [Parcubacteria group bacterium GW2011_GWC2_39_14]KKR54344.1 MAG: hypothetical protein UT91_C0018G0018 [Parcubacteria group bacterium GW2011_GWA2_40_23]